jgi:hypothetical protein
MQHEKPWYVQFVAVFFLGLSIMWILGFASTLRLGDLSHGVLLRALVEAITVGVAGWWLLKGITWGYLLGVALGSYWWLFATRTFLSSTRHGSTLMAVVWFYLVIGSVVFAGLLMPRSRKWFRGTWQARNDPSFGT